MVETSCHGATPETFDAITQVPGSFRRFQEGIRLLLERNIPVTVKTSAMTLNKQELDAIKRFVERLGLRFQVSSTICPALDGDLSPCQYRLTPDEVVELEYPRHDQDETAACPAAGAPEPEADTGLRPPPDDRLFRCGCGTTAVHVNAWGALGACTWVTEPRADLRETSVGDAIAQVFSTVRAARYETETACRSCRVHSYCDKMPSIAWAENADPEQPVEHFCEVAFKRAARADTGV